MPPTLARRYIFKLLANMASVPVYLVMEAILPRALGPQTYGDYNFATNLFQQLSGFLDMGTSTCFYNALSRRQRETALFSFYLRIVLFVACALIVSSLFVLWPPAGNWLMPDMPLQLAPLAAIWAFLTWLGRVLRSTNDALGATIPSELWRASLSLAGAVFLACLFFMNLLNIQTLFLQQYLLLGATCAAFWLVSHKHWARKGLQTSFKLPPAPKKAYAAEFFAYSHPLLAQALLSFAMLTAERWLLQWFDGSAQQGFYALSQKVSMACFLFVSAMTPLLMREFSVAWGKGDLAQMGSLLSRFAPGLYMLAAYFSCFTVAEAQELVRIFGGPEFAAAALPVQIMALYPLHQAYGQMAGSIFHASGKTRILRNITACECVYGLACAWFLLAPERLLGLNLGAAGLAIKTVSVQFVTVNVYLWLASRMVPFPFWRNLLHQITSVALLVGFACFSKYLSLQTGLDYLFRFSFSGIIYTFLVVAAAAAFPRLIGLSRKDCRELARRFCNKRAG